MKIDSQKLKKFILDAKLIKEEDFIKAEIVPSFKILVRLTTSDGIKKALSQYQESLESEFGEIMKTGAGEIKHIKEEQNQGGKEELEKHIILEVSKLIRAYDPCMSCASHFLKVKWKESH